MRRAWVVLCPEEERPVMVAALEAIGSKAEYEFAQDAEDLRRRMATSVPGERSALIGLTKSGVSDINLAAAIASDGYAEEVVLALRSPSGSLRSRAARAGIDRVVDLDGVCSASSEEKGATPASGFLPECDGGRVSVTSGPALALSGVRAPIVTFCSGRGGVGKTSVVACAAVAAASWGMRVEAVDLDLSCGDLFAMFGLPRGTDLSALSIDDLGDKEQRLGRLGTSCGERVRVWGPCERPETAELANAAVPGLLDALASASDLVLVDTSPTFTEAVALAVCKSDRVVLVHDRRPGSLASLSRASGLAVRLGVARTRIARLENYVDVRDRTDPAFGRAEVGLEAARAFTALNGGGEVADYLGYGDVAGLLEVGSPFAESVAACLAQLLQELGALPEVEAAKRAAGGIAPRRRGLFGRRREAV
ncbi:MAG: hypothetical protein LKE43_05990 [Olsenella sp.]|nr:hypothetical protein [Olsenella sp.]